MLRFAYYQPSSWPDESCCESSLPVGENTCCVTEPPPDRILAHISTLGTILQSWTHAIVAVQTGFIGPWGEGHASTHFRTCSAAEVSKGQIVAALVDAVPDRQIQIRNPSLKQVLSYQFEEPDMTSITENIISNGGFEDNDDGWGVGVGSSDGIEVINTDAITGNSIKINAGNSAQQSISLSQEQGAQQNIIKISGHSKLYDAPAVLPAENDYSIYVDVTFTDNTNMWGVTASFCGSGDWESASTYLQVPEGKTISSVSVHLMYINTDSGYALFDDVSITVFAPYSMEISSDNAFDGSDIASTGHHNDCFLASDTDYGTYSSNNVEAEKSYLENDTKYTSIGGETCALNSPRSDCKL